jgi:glycerol kinase
LSPPATRDGCLLALDQGTTSTRAIVFDARLHPLGSAQLPLRQSFPQPGWVEHDPEEIWGATQSVCRQAVDAAGLDPARLLALGLTNQRETVVLWERESGRPVHPAIVWQDRRTTAACAALAERGALELVQRKTGLLLDPYFSASKIAWLLDHVPGARARAGRGELLCGTIDSWLLWKLTGGPRGGRHATDATNASRTSLFDIVEQRWDDELLGLFGVPRAILPEVLDSCADFGAATPELLGRPLPIAGIAGDQQAAAIGQACWDRSRIKSTYGTGCFLLLNTGDELVRSAHRLLGTVAVRLAGHPRYALEGSIFSAGSTVQWLRDGLRLFHDSAESETLAARAAREAPGRRVHLVPAFTGLGAPWWDAEARGAILGLTRDVTVADLARAALESVGHQTADLLDALARDGAPRPAVLRVDGGMTANGFAMQFLADILELPIERPVVTETTALGAAGLAGLQAGLFASRQALEAAWALDRRFEPSMSADERLERRAGWRDALQRVLTAAPART